MTPKYVFEEIKEYIPRGKTIWMPFYGDGKAGQHMKELGFDVIHQPEDFWSNDHGKIVVDNDGLHSKKTVSNEIYLKSGMHQIQVDYFERGGQESLTVNWKGPGFDWMEIPKFKLFHTLS